MSRTPPAPRPALRKAADGSVHPASPHQSSLVVEAGAVQVAARKGRKGRPPKAGKDGKDAKGDEPVELAVSMSKAERKRLRRKAESYGWTAEEAAAHVLRVWADG